MTNLTVDRQPNNFESNPSILDVLETDHAEIDRLLQDTVAAINQADVVRTFEHLDLFWARLAMHIRAEHRWLFPAVRDAAEGSPAEFGHIPEILETLRRDHDFFMRDLARAVKAMRLVFYFGNEKETLVVVRELLDGVTVRLEDHNRLEEESIYTLPTREFPDPAVTGELLRSIRKELTNYPHRFAGSRST